MKIHEYDQMMKYLTRPADPRTKEQKPMKILKYLDVMGKNYGDKNIRVKSDQEYEKIEADAKAEYLKKNPTYPTEASSAEMEALKGRLDNARAFVTPPKKTKTITKIHDSPIGTIKEIKKVEVKPKAKRAKWRYTSWADQQQDIVSEPKKVAEKSKEKPKIKEIDLAGMFTPGKTLSSLTEAEREAVNNLLKLNQ